MLNKSLKREILVSTIVGFLFCFFFITSFARNPFTVYSGYDQSIFEQMGLGMLHGRIPYVDLFDHKGFLLYVINAIGLFLCSGHTGIFILLSLCLSLTFFFWVRTSEMLVGQSLRYVPSLVTLLFACLCQGGNLTETWSLLPVSFPIYLLVRRECKAAEISLGECFLIGLCVGATANMRLNNIIPIVSVCLYMFVVYLYMREYKRLTYCALAVFSGFLFLTLGLVGIYVALYGVGYLENYWFCNIVFNLLYVENFATQSLWESPGVYFPLASMIMMMCVKRCWKNCLTYFVLVAFFATLLTTGKSYFPHYFTLFSPMIVLALSLSIGKKIRLHCRHMHRLLAISAVAILISVIAFFEVIKGVVDDYMAREDSIKETAELLRQLPDSQKESIWNYNAMMAGTNILNCAEVVQCNRVFLPFQASDSYGAKERGTIQSLSPEIILIDEYTDWSGNVRGEDVLESVGNPTDSCFLAQNYCLIHRCRSIIQNKRILVYQKRHVR